MLVEYGKHYLGIPYLRIFHDGTSSGMDRYWLERSVDEFLPRACSVPLLVMRQFSTALWGFGPVRLGFA